MDYDITNPSSSYEWLLETLKMKGSELIDNFLIDCNRDFEEFYEAFEEVIDSIDIENLRIVAFHATTCSNSCADIKEYGLRNLQWVLTNDTDLNRFLRENDVRFDVNRKRLYIDETVYDVEYIANTDTDIIPEENKHLHNIGRKLYNDYQINAFLHCKHIDRYSTIHKAPEFLDTISSLNRKANNIYISWKSNSKAYVVKFVCKMDDLDWNTFYDREAQYIEDRQNKFTRLKRKLVSYAIDSAFGELIADVYVYMRKDTVISVDNIIEYVPLEQWSTDS